MEHHMAEQQGRYYKIPHIACNGAPGDPQRVEKFCNQQVQSKLYDAINAAREDDKGIREVEHLIKDTLAFIKQTERPTALSLETCRPLDWDDGTGGHSKGNSII